MTKTYNVTLKGMVQQIINSANYINDKKNNNNLDFYIVLPFQGSKEEIKLDYKDVFKIAQIIENNPYMHDHLLALFTQDNTSSTPRKVVHSPERVQREEE